MDNINLFENICDLIELKIYMKRLNWIQDRDIWH